MSRYKSYGYNGRRRGSKVFWIFLAIILFGAIYYPFYGKDLRFEIGTLVSEVFNTIGALLIIIGIILTLIAFFQAFSKVPRSALKAIRNEFIAIIIFISGHFLTAI